MGAQKTVLIVDDNREIRVFLDLALSTLGFASEGVATAKEALVLARERRHDVFMVDISLVEGPMEGIGLIEAIRASGDTRPILVFTGIRDADKIGRCYAAGADIVIMKPGSLRLIGAALERATKVVGKTATGVETDDEFEAFGAKALPQRMELVFSNGNRVSVSHKELGILRSFVRGRGGVVRREALLEEVWGGQAALNSNTLDTYVSKIRANYRKNGVALDDIITAQFKVGWKISE